MRAWITAATVTGTSGFCRSTVYGFAGRTARRYARVMTDAPAILLRPVQPLDSADLLAWRNDPLTRANSSNTAAIELATHSAWLERAFADPDRRPWIAARGGETLGTVAAAPEAGARKSGGGGKSVCGRVTLG